MRRISILFIAAILSVGAFAQSQLDEAVSFLYKYMPAADKANHSESFFRDQARYALYARLDMPWGESVPDSIWRHFVLPPRANNEELDNFRPVMYHELRRRVERLTMREAALEVNHWCHEYVTYRPSDSRTSAPLATIRNGYGRCGEESVLAVAAMRAVGIPARQVYTPRWAHTDDNHAWIEVWVDGRWHFMGACEPEPVLNLGWFNASAARALLMHTQVFGDWRGPEDVIQRNASFTEINCIANYVPTRRNIVTVVDGEGRPVEGARVEFKIFNYSEFYSVVALTTDAAGQVALTTGLGDMLAWASKDGRFGYAKIDSPATTVCLNHRDGDKISEDIDIVPPAEGLIPVDVTDEQIAANKLRLAAEDSIRASRQRHWITAERALQHGHDSTEASFIAKAQGNSHLISRFLRHSAGQQGPSARKRLLLANLTDKDLRDVTLDVLVNALKDAPESRFADDIYGPYILSPRVEMEPLRPFTLPDRMRHMTADEVIAWTRDSIAIVGNPRGLRFTPQAVYDSRQADARSRNIFFVALCRKNGIPARIESVTGRTEYYTGDAWLNVVFEQQQAEARSVRKGKLRLDYTPTPLHPDLDYYRHFTITRIENGRGSLLNYEEGENTEMGATMTASRFAQGQPMAVGYYMVTTGSRMSSGKVLAHIETRNVVYPRTVAMPVALREGGADDVSVKGYFDAEPLLPQTGRGYFLAVIGGKHDEPTNHARAELRQIDSFLTQWGRPVLMLDADDNAALADELRNAVNSRQRDLPVVVIADSFGRIVYYSEGYNTSMGEQLKRTISHL